MSQVTEVTAESFEREALAPGEVAVVDFFAGWCRPCRRIEPLIERLAAEEPGLRVLKLDIDAAPALAERYGVASIPCVVRFDAGRVTARSVGAVSYRRLRANLRVGAAPARTVRATLAGVVVAESERTVAVEGRHYFPPEDVRRELLGPPRGIHLCPWKGIARYHDVEAGGLRVPRGAWVYRHPYPWVRRIRGRFAFWQGIDVG